MFNNFFIKMNKKAIKNGDIPVSCIITKNNKIISSAYNNKYKKNNPLGHAEIIAIQKACKKLNTCNLIDCELYVTLKPCLMCQEIIKETRIKTVHYIIDNNKYNNSKINYLKIDKDSDIFEKELKDFFKSKR